MIFFGSVFLAVVLSWRWAARAKLVAQEWFMLFLMVFLGLWSGLEFWYQVFQIISYHLPWL